jgi:hypothetical protein
MIFRKCGAIFSKKQSHISLFPPGFAIVIKAWKGADNSHRISIQL